MSIPMKVYEASHAIQAYALSNHLFDHGIEAHVSGQHHVAETLGGNIDRAELWVAQQDVTRAREILKNWEQANVEKSTLVSTGSLQFGLSWILANLTVFAFVFSIIAITQVGEPSGLPVSVVTPMVLTIVGANLMYIAYYRRKRERFADEEHERIE